MGGRLEHEIRLLPQVLSCSFSKDDNVVVLVDPSADPDHIHRAVEEILRNAGSEAGVRVIGPAEAVEAAATRTISPLLATATVATVAAIGVGALVGGIAVADHHAKPSAPPKAPSKPAAIVPATSAVSPMDSIDALRRVQVSAVTTIAAPAVPAEAPDGAIRVLPISRGFASEAISLTRAIPPLHRASETTSIRSPDDDHEGHGRNMTKGPPPWSHSHRHPASNHRGKGTDRG